MSLPSLPSPNLPLFPVLLPFHLLPIPNQEEVQVLQGPAPRLAPGGLDDTDMGDGRENQLGRELQGQGEYTG